ncbi:rhamnogalacturonan acetylesterase [Venturia nashicola]|uniref:Rhamnogalacturonan acetylesterase n=1 Tax=Venturia nashicola TaxID=86259 RepID=A0A4Z1PGM8_9PEZI|nr:rhamnogalacturonan acetylesterase [Venturia nashicola]
MKISNTQLAVAITACISLCAAYPKLIISGGTNVAEKFEDGLYRGWPGFLLPLLNVNIMDQAVHESSVRSTYNTRPWDRIYNLVRPDDYVVLEFGIEDEGDPQYRTKNGSLNLKASLPGTGDETVTVTYVVTDTKTLPNGTVVDVPGSARNQTEVVHTFGWYLKNMVIDMREANARVIISSRIPKNWNMAANGTTDTLDTNYKFRDYAQQVAEELKVDFVDHTYYTLRLLKELGPAESNKLYGHKSIGSPNRIGLDYLNMEGGRGMAESFYSPRICATPLFALPSYYDSPPNVSKLLSPNNLFSFKFHSRMEAALITPPATANTFIQGLRCSGSNLLSYLSDEGKAVKNVACSTR